MKRIAYFIIISWLTASCATTKNIAYFQDEQIGWEQEVAEPSLIRIKHKDMISIVISSKDPELAALFNLPRIQHTAGLPNNGLFNTSQNGQILGYTVDSNGDIDFPVLGKLHISGLSREEIARFIKEQLISKDLIKDPVVTVDFLNLSYSVLGEVLHPGQFGIAKDKVTILEAISSAGDLTIYGKRDKIYLTRLSDHSRITYSIDLRTGDFYNSPAFYVQQNDVIYVEPNKVRANQSTVNGNNVRSVSLWMSIASFLTTLGVLIFK